MELSWLNMRSPTPEPGQWWTGRLKLFCPLKSTETSPAPLTRKSVQLQTSPKACLPMMMGLVQLLTSRGMFLMMMGYLKTVPLRQFRMVPLGDFHIFFNLNSSTLASSGVMVAHLMPTLHFLMASAASMVTLSSVLSLYSMPRSKYWMLRSRKGWMSSSLMNCQKILVISSPSSSATGLATFIFWLAKEQERADLLTELMHLDNIQQNLINKYLAIKYNNQFLFTTRPSRPYSLPVQRFDIPLLISGSGRQIEFTLDEAVLFSIILKFQMLQGVEQSKKPEKAKVQYATVNGWTHPLPCWQIFAIGLMFVIEVINFYLLHKIIDLGFIILYVLEGISIIFLVLIIVYFFLLTFSDPSDPRLKDPSYSQPEQKLTKCYGCMTQVSQNAYHCNTCKRCVDNFDHHCVFLNNCIGAQNYSMFWKFLLWMFIHMALGIAIDLVVFVEEEGWNRWLALAFVIVQFVVLLEVAILGIFHCYIGLCLYKTTLQVLRGDKKSKVAPDTHTQPNAPQTPNEPQPMHNSKMVSIRPSSQMEDKVVETPSPSKEKESDPHESTEVGFKYGTL